MAEQLQFDFEFPSHPPTTLPELWTADDVFQFICDYGAEAFNVFPTETDLIEFKSARFAVRDLGDYFSMWANTQPSGPGSRSWGMREERSAVCRWIFDADLGRVPKRRPVCASAQ